jgi:hypothetical protein
MTTIGAENPLFLCDLLFPAGVSGVASLDTCRRLFVCFLLALRAFGQTYNGSFTRDIKDPTGALIPGPTVTIVDAGRGYTYTATAESTSSRRPLHSP